MLPGETTLEINCIRRFHRTIGRKLDGRTLDESTCCHDHLAVISRHIPRLWCYKAVYRCSSLDTLAECYKTFRCSESDRLDDILTWLCAVGNYRETKLFVNVRCKNSAFKAPLVIIGARKNP